MQIVEVDFIFDGEITVLVSGSMANTTFHAATSEPHRVALRIVIASVISLGHGRSSKFASPQHKCFI